MRALTYIMTLLLIFLHSECISSTFPVKIVIFPDNVTASRLGQTFLLPCVAVSAEAAGHINMTWLYNGRPLTPASSNFKVLPPITMKDDEGLLIVASILEVCVTSAEDIATISCTASTRQLPSNLQEDKETFHFDASLLVSKSPESNVEVNIDTAQTFSCEFATSHSQLAINWTINNVSAHQYFPYSVDTKTNEEGNTVVTTVLNVFYTHTLPAEYACYAKYNHRKVHANFQVQVQVPFFISASLPSTSYYDATLNTAILICVAYGLRPPEVTWKHGESLLDDQDDKNQAVIITRRAVSYSVHIVMSFLRLCLANEAGTDDGDTYSCEVYGGGLNTADATLTVDVCSAPSRFGFLVAPVDTTVETGGAVYLSCVAYNTHGREVHLSWRKASGAPINSTGTTVMQFLQEKHDDLHISRSILAISCITQEDTGHYMCVASDSIETQQANFTLSHHYLIFMELMDIDTTRSVEHMASISFSCVVSASPTPAVTWLKDGIPLLESENVLIEENMTAGFTEQAEVALNSTLTLVTVTAADSGQYWCRAENMHHKEEMKTKYQLTVLDSPGQTGLHNAGTIQAVYAGEVLCIAALLAVIVTHSLSRRLRSMAQTIPLVNFCIATSFVSLFSILSSSMSWPSAVCTVFAALLHISLLTASLAISNLIILRPKKVNKIANICALLLNWVLPVVVFVLSIGLDVHHYTKRNDCLPGSWALWLGLVLPLGAAHLVSWVVLILAYILHSCTGDIGNTQSGDISNTHTGDISNTESGDISKAHTGDMSNTLTGNISKARTEDISTTLTGDISNTLTEDISNARTGDKSNARTGDTSNACTATCCDIWYRDTLAIACLLLLVGLSWGTGLASRSLAIDSSSSSTPVYLRIISVVASAMLGLLTLIHFCFLSPVVRSEVKRILCVSPCHSPQIKPVDEPRPIVSPRSLCEMDFVVVTVPLPQGLEDMDKDEIFNKTTYL